MTENKTAKLAKEITETKKKQTEQAKSSLIANRAGQTKVFDIAKGTDNEYSVTLQFPGTFAASNIRSHSMNEHNYIDQTEFMESLIDEHVIISPKITGLDFFDTHKGYDELYYKSINFFAERLN